VDKNFIKKQTTQVWFACVVEYLDQHYESGGLGIKSKVLMALKV
jgi:hypothetical protein